MEISGSAATGALRVGLHIATQHKKPVLEIYYEVKNQSGPETEYQLPSGPSGTTQSTHKHRHQNIFIPFTLLNIGGTRARNIKMNMTGNLDRSPPRSSLKEKLETEVPQLPPGQQHFLFALEQHDLETPSEDEKSPPDSSDKSFTITIEYDAPKGFLNWTMALPKKLCGKRRYKTSFTFSRDVVYGDLPPVEYVG